MLKWLARAAKEGWTGGRLDYEIKREKHVKGSQGGPPFKKQNDLLEALDHVLQHSNQWLKRYEGCWSQDRCWPPTTGYGQGNRAILADRLEEVRECLNCLRQASNDLRMRIAEIGQDILSRPERKGGVAKARLQETRSNSR
jgi:hypothetical protein